MQQISCLAYDAGRLFCWGVVMFGLFKSKEQRASEMMADISKGMISGAIEDNGIDINGAATVDDFSVQGSKAVGRIILNKLGIGVGEGTGDDIFVAGAFVVGAGNYISHNMSGNFEVIAGAALVAFYSEEGVDDVGSLTSETINAYNSLMTDGKLGVAMMGCIAKFFENSGEEHLDKLVELYKICREFISE